MQQIVDAIVDYVNKENTDFAVMLDGSWGSGKTYFWENTLRPAIEKQKKGDKNFKTIYISLYGIENLNDISKSIFYEVYSPTNEKLKKISQSKVGNAISEMGKMLINAGSGLVNMNLPNSGDINYDKLFDLENKILCFDDLERANFDISQILGYINNFVEHDQTKVIILCNEKEISNNLISNNLELKTLVSTYVLDKAGRFTSKESLQEENLKTQSDLINQGITDIFDRSNNYKRIKEKLIGKSLRYIAEYKLIIENIVKSLSDNNTYKSFLNDNLEIVYRTFILSNTYNIRILKQSLWDFETIYLSSNTFYPNIDIGILKRMLIFNIALSLEIRSGKLVNLFDGINSNEELQSKLIMNKMTNENKTSIEEEFINRYFPKSIYNFTIFFNSIDKLVREGILHKDVLKRELDRLMQNDNTPPHYKLMKSFWDLTDEEFNSALQLTYNNVINGDIAFQHYLRLFIVFNQISNMGLLKKSRENIKKDIFQGLKKAGQKGRYFEDINITFFNMGDIEEDEDIRLLKQEIVKINQNLLNKAEQEAVIFLIEEINRNQSEGLIRLRKEYMYKPFFCYCKIDIFYSVVVARLSNSNLTVLRNFIINRHKTYDEKLIKDFSNLLKLKKYIDHNIQNKKVTLSLALLNELSTTIEKVTNDLENTKTTTSKKRRGKYNQRRGRFNKIKKRVRDRNKRKF
ncbi:MAG: P-loop NTPase fold protein [Anaerobacillus sp.]|uniref:P-loop NTPase fold protein n=1 Tax=Anaerobacillus sp. TaxID=1872506 RepID=UPI00391B3391